MRIKVKALRFEITKPAILLLSLALLCNGCRLLTDKKIKSPKGYDLNKPVRIKLPQELSEISGVHYYTKDTSVLAVNDEFGTIYKIYLNQPDRIEKWKFGKGGDYEDMVLLDSNFYVLKSKGDIVCFRYISFDSLYYAEYPFPFGKGNEFEILYYDYARKKLMLICKSCEGDKKDRAGSYSFDPWTLEFAPGNFSIDVSGIADETDKKKIEFKPSAAAIHPLTGQLYLVSAVNNMLVIADTMGHPEKVFSLDHETFPQPEGLAFTPAGTMIISNEAADEGAADILVFPYNFYQKQQKKK